MLDYLPRRTLMLFCCVFSRAQAESWTKLGADIDDEVAGERSGSSVSPSADGRRLARVGAPYNGGNAESANVVGAVAGARLVAIGAGTGVVLALAYVALNRRIKAQRSPAFEPPAIGIALSGNNRGGAPSSAAAATVADGGDIVAVATAAAAALLGGGDITAVAISPPPSYRESTPAVATGSRVLAAGNSNDAPPVVVGMVL